MFILTLSVFNFLPFRKNFMKFDLFTFRESLFVWNQVVKLFAILHLPLQLVCQNLCEHGID